jgi:hypothetical protein
MKQRTLLAAIAVLACARPQYRSADAEVVLTVEGRVRGSPVAFDAAALRALDQRTVRGQDPRASSTHAYEGASLEALIRELDPKREVDLAIVHGRGGYAVAIPLPAIRQHRPVLAERADGRPIAEMSGEHGRFALVWPNVQAPGFDEDPRTRWWWPRDVTRIELIPWSATYGRALRVPSGAGDRARHGADAYATRCIHCHRLRDAGGKRGPDLSRGIAPEGRERFVAAVRAHADRIPELKGADLTRGLPEITAFLEAVESAGPTAPGEEPPPEELPDQPKPGEEMPPPMPPGGPLGMTMNTP